MRKVKQNELVWNSLAYYACICISTNLCTVSVCKMRVKICVVGYNFWQGRIRTNFFFFIRDEKRYNELLMLVFWCHSCRPVAVAAQWLFAIECRLLCYTCLSFLAINKTFTVVLHTDGYKWSARKICTTQSILVGCFFSFVSYIYFVFYSLHVKS